MNRVIVTAFILSAVGLVSCDNKSNEAYIEPLEVKVNQSPDVKSPQVSLVKKGDVVERLIARDPSDNGGMIEDATLLYDHFGEIEARDISNSLWAGINGFDRNRRAAGAIAVIAFEDEPRDWSTVRAGIAYVNGLGVNQNATKAISILSQPSLSESSAAQFFLAKAYQLDNQNTKAKLHFEKAANMGHRLAKEELAKQN